MGALGFLRDIFWQTAGGMYGDHYARVEETLCPGLIGGVFSGAWVGSTPQFVDQGVQR